MGRQESALAEQTARGLAQRLRSLRQASGLTLTQVEIKTELQGRPISRSSLSRAENGSVRGLPYIAPWATVEAFTTACGGDPAETKRLWSKAAAARTSPRTGTSVRHTAMRPEYVSEPAELLQAMRQLRVERGGPSLRELERRAVDPDSGISDLPTSSLSPVLQGTRKCSRRILLHYVRALGVHDEQALRRWADAWDRADTHQRGEAGDHLRRRLAGLEQEMRETRNALDSLLAKSQATRATDPHPSLTVRGRRARRSRTRQKTGP